MYDNFDDIHDVPMLDKAQIPLWRLKDKSSLCYIVFGELEGIEWFVKHLSHTNTKVHNNSSHIYT